MTYNPWLGLKQKAYKKPFCKRGHDILIVGRNKSLGCNQCVACDRRKNQLRKDHGISLAEYNRMFQIQGGMCALCSIHQSNLKVALCVDHCHKTQRIRGLLCTRCNVELGLFERIDVKVFRNYLRRKLR